MSIKYLWHTFPWLNKPIKSWREWKKKAVLVKVPKTWKYKVVHFGAVWYSDFTKHKDPDRRASYRARHAAIKNKSGKPAIKDKTSPAYRSYNYLR